MKDPVNVLGECRDGGCVHTTVDLSVGSTTKKSASANTKRDHALSMRLGFSSLVSYGSNCMFVLIGENLFLSCPRRVWAVWYGDGDGDDMRMWCEQSRNESPVVIIR